ncbi:MAG: site-specific integrase [Chloroflexi bacterium]|nr:site-specific integrase [Chloroflexota bacterium]
MARRGVQEGSVYRRADGRWVAVLHVGYSGGKRQRKSFYGATRQEVASRLAGAVRDRQLGKSPVPEREKLGDFLNRWLEDTARRSIRVSTYAIYEVSLRKHIIPAIGHLKLARLSADDLDGLYSRLLSGGLSPKTVRMIHAVLHRALSHAQRRGAIAVNPASVAAPPSAPRREFRTLAPDEAALLLKAALSDRLYGVYLLALTCGLRQGEILGLRWADVDLNRAVLHVRQQVYRMAGEWVFSEPKTAAGRRTVSLSGSAVEALRERRLAQNKERLRAETWEDLDLVFSNRRGNPIDKANLLRGSFWPLLERAGLPHMRFHDLRHSCASLLLAEGVHPKVVQEMLGHSSISVTLDIYSHVLPSMQADAAEKMDRLLAASN